MLQIYTKLDEGEWKNILQPEAPPSSEWTEQRQVRTWSNIHMHNKEKHKEKDGEAEHRQNEVTGRAVRVKMPSCQDAFSNRHKKSPTHASRTR